MKDKVWKQVSHPLKMAHNHKKQVKAIPTGGCRLALSCSWLLGPLLNVPLHHQSSLAASLTGVCKFDPTFSKNRHAQLAASRLKFPLVAGVLGRLHELVDKMTAECTCSSKVTVFFLLLILHASIREHSSDVPPIPSMPPLSNLRPPPLPSTPGALISTLCKNYAGCYPYTIHNSSDSKAILQLAFLARLLIS